MESSTPTVQLSNALSDEHAQTLASWHSEDVAALVEALGLGDYSDALRSASNVRTVLTHADHEIDGAAIAVADHEMLRDLGFRTVGHRLVLLRAVYDIKCREGWSFDGDWLPPYERSAPSFAFADDADDYDEPLTPRISKCTLRIAS